MSRYSPATPYRLAVPAYLVEGGDDWSWASEHFGLARRIVESGAQKQNSSARQLVSLYLKQLGKIGSVPTRIKFEEPHSKHSKRAPRRHSHHKKRQ